MHNSEFSRSSTRPATISPRTARRWVRFSLATRCSCCISVAASAKLTSVSSASPALAPAAICRSRVAGIATPTSLKRRLNRRACPRVSARSCIRMRCDGLVTGNNVSSTCTTRLRLAPFGTEFALVTVSSEKFNGTQWGTVLTSPGDYGVCRRSRAHVRSRLRALTHCTTRSDVPECSCSFAGTDTASSIEQLAEFRGRRIQ